MRNAGGRTERGNNQECHWRRRLVAEDDEHVRRTMKNKKNLSHTMYGIFTYMWVKFMVNVKGNIPYMDPMGYAHAENISVPWMVWEMIKSMFFLFTNIEPVAVQ